MRSLVAVTTLLNGGVPMQARRDKGKGKGRFSRIHIPVLRTTTIHSSPLQASNEYGNSAFDQWMRDTQSKSVSVEIWHDSFKLRAKKHYELPREIVKAMQQPYDIESIARVNERGGLKQFIKLLCPSLNAERQYMLYEKLCSMLHARQREHEIAQRPALITGDKDHRARRLSKSERRALREGKGKRTTR